MNKPIAFLGTGLLGAAFVKAMLGRQQQVRVWNRTESKARALEAFGAQAFASIEEAVNGAERIHVALKDDASVDEVLQQASKAFAGNVVVIDHTTITREGAIARSEYWSLKGVHYQHAPVFMGPANALEASGFMLVSGNQSLIAQLEPELQVMTGTLLNLGPELGKAAALKLTGNTFLVTFMFALRETIAVAKSLGLEVSDVAGLLDQWNPAQQLKTRLDRLTSPEHVQPSWELNMARKDTQLFIDAAARANTPLALLPHIAAVMDKCIARGDGNRDWTVVGRDVVMKS